MAKLLLVFMLLICGCSNSSTLPAITNIPIAAFEVMPTSGNAPMIVSCENLTTPIDADMHWMFGDGGITNDTHPIYTFETPGIYSIVLVATNSAGTSDMTIDGIEVYGPEPPPPPPGGFPPGPDELQDFMYTGFNEVIPYNQGISTDFYTSVFVREEGIDGTPSRLGGFAVSFNYVFEGDEDFAVALDTEWSEWIMSLNGGDGPDLIIGGLYAGNEVNVGCIANTALPVDYWYLPHNQWVELMRVNFYTIPWVLVNGSWTMDFFIEDSALTNVTNVVSVDMPVTGTASATIDNGHLSVFDWKLELIP